MRVMASSFLRFLDHIQRRTTVGRTPLDEWSARRRDLYLTTHNTHNRQTSIPPVGFEPTISAGERSQTCALDRAATRTGEHYSYRSKMPSQPIQLPYLGAKTKIIRTYCTALVTINHQHHHDNNNNNTQRLGMHVNPALSDSSSSPRIGFFTHAVCDNVNTPCRFWFLLLRLTCRNHMILYFTLLASSPLIMFLAPSVRRHSQNMQCTSHHSPLTFPCQWQRQFSFCFQLSLTNSHLHTTVSVMLECEKRLM